MKQTHERDVRIIVINFVQFIGTVSIDPASLITLKIGEERRAGYMGLTFSPFRPTEPPTMPPARIGDGDMS